MAHSSASSRVGQSNFAYADSTGAFSSASNHGLPAAFQDMLRDIHRNHSQNLRRPQNPRPFRGFNQPLFSFRPAHMVDPDNMDYQSLLDLQDRIGHVHPANRPASRQTVDQLPTSSYKRPTKPQSSGGNDRPRSHEAKQEAKAGQENNSCCICLCEFEDGDEVRSLPCFHMFHKEEIDRWLAQNNKCPICKHSVDG